MQVNLEEEEKKSVRERERENKRDAKMIDRFKQMNNETQS